MAGRLPSIVQAANSMGHGGGGLGTLPSVAEAAAASGHQVHKKHHSSFWHGLSKGIKGVGQVGANIGVGVYQSSRQIGHDVGESFAHPIRASHKKSQFYEKTLVPTGKAYAHKYGPAVTHPLSGKAWETTGKRMAHDPLGTILDVATVATLGTAGAVKVGAIPAAAEKFTLESEAARAGVAGGKTVPKVIRGSQMSRHLKIQAQKALNRLNPETRLVGQEARFGRALRKEHKLKETTLKQKAAPYGQASAKLSKRERFAANLIHNFPARSHLDEYRQSLIGEPKAAATLKALEDPKMLKLYDTPTPRMQEFLKQSAELGKAGTKIGGVSADTALRRRFMPLLMLRGARIAPDMTKIRGLLDSDHVSVSRKRVIQQFVDDLGGGAHEANPALRAHYPTPEEIVKRAKALRLPVKLTAPQGRTIPEMVRELRQELKQADRPEPMYQPHTSVEPKGTGVGAGGTAIQAKLHHQSTGVLATLGRARFDIDTQHAGFMRSVKHAVYSDRHSDLLRSGIELNAGQDLPAGYVYIKHKLSEQIPYTQKTGGQFEQEMGLERDYANELTTTNNEDALVGQEGGHIAVRESTVRRVVGEYTRNDRALTNLLKKPTDVWRAMVLNGRVGWLVNNVVGNTLMYGLGNAGPGGLRAYLGAIADTKGPQWVVRHLLDNKETVSRLTPHDLAELIPDQVAGTFFGTQAPRAGKLGAVTHGKFSPFRVLRQADQTYEQALRRAMANRIVHRSEEATRVYRSMPKQERSWREAMRQALESNPQLARRVSAEINSTLGDFTNLSHLEQGALRQLVPFYGWYRAIFGVVAKMPVDTPLRAQVLVKLGEIGKTEQATGYPYGGAIPIGEHGIFKTAGMNPYATVPQVGGNLAIVGRAALGHVPGTHIKSPEASDIAYSLGGVVNPLAILPFAGGVSGVATGLPETQLVFPRVPKHPEKSLYADYGHKASGLSYLGLPYRKLRGPNRPAPPSRP